MPIQLQSPGAQAVTARPSSRAAVLLEAVGRSYSHAGRDVQALDGVSFAAAQGEVLALVGPSGCGKTTLLELVCGLQSADAGVVRSDAAVLMPQRDLLLPWLDATGNAALPLRIAGRSRGAARERAGAMFAELGLGGFERAYPVELSGGMRQRVAFLRTLLSGKPVLCLDEPFGALDAITRGELQQWLASALRREPRTVLLVTHDVEEAVLLADRVLVLCPRPGRVTGEVPIELPRPRDVTDERVAALRARVLALMSEARAERARRSG
ncbi:MAG TPA: ABC transporter ATP-binding protein [Solirubrobacteraceae bacterium]